MGIKVNWELGLQALAYICPLLRWRMVASKPKIKWNGLVSVSFWSLSYIHKERRKEVCKYLQMEHCVQDQSIIRVFYQRVGFWSCASVNANKWRMFLFEFGLERISFQFAEYLFCFYLLLLYVRPFACDSLWVFKVIFICLLFLHLCATMCFHTIIINFSCDFQNPCSRFWV